MFVSEKPVVLDQLKEVFPELKPSQIHDLIKQLQEEYVNRECRHGGRGDRWRLSDAFQQPRGRVYP